MSNHWVLALLDKVNDLKQLPRTGWLLAGVSAPESIAEHCYATALLALLLGEAINAEWAALGLARPLDLERVLRIALLHDLAESVLTDLPRRSADLFGRAAKHAAEAQVTQQIFADMPTGAVYAAYWQEYDAAATPEAQIVRDADKLELVHQALRYEERGQRNLHEFWQGHTWHFPTSAALFAELQTRRATPGGQGAGDENR